jgi:hypothetical protein
LLPGKIKENVGLSLSNPFCYEKIYNYFLSAGLGQILQDGAIRPFVTMAAVYKLDESGTHGG